MTTSEIASNIRAELGRKRISQRELARQLGISPTAMHMRLRGETRIPSDELVQIAQLLELDPAELLKGAA